MLELPGEQARQLDLPSASREIRRPGWMSRLMCSTIRKHYAVTNKAEMLYMAESRKR